MAKELTHGSPAKLILAFTMPLLIGNIFQQFYSMADTLIVGRTLGVHALAAVGSTGSLSFLILGFVQGFTTGLAINVANRFGAGDYRGLRKSIATAIVISGVLTILLTFISVAFSRQILSLMHTPPEIIEDAYSYIVIIFAGTIANVMFNLFSNIIRALGDSKTPLIFLVIACIINIVLDIIFITRLHMGVAGAAWATIISQMISSVLCILYIVKRLPVIHLKKEDWRIKTWELRKQSNIAVPMGFQMSIIAIGAIILQYVLNGLGAISVAAFTAAGKIDQIAAQPMNSFGTTMATYTAQNYGAGKIHRIQKGVKQCIYFSGGFSIVMGVINVVFGANLTGLFVGKNATKVMELSQTYLSINGTFYLFLALLFILRFTLQGLGKSTTPTIAGIMELVMRTMAAIFLARWFGFAGACWASPLAWIGAFIPLVIDYLRTMKHLRKEQDIKSIKAEETA